MKILTNIWVMGILALIAFAAPMAYLLMTFEPEPPPQTKYDEEVDGASVAALWNAQTSHIEKMVQELKDRQAELDKRAEELNQREERIGNEKQELERIQEDIRAQQQKLDDMVMRISNQEVENLRSQATVFSEMDAEEVVEIFETMENLEVAKILFFMETDIQSEIFTAMVEAGRVRRGGARGNTQANNAERVKRLNELLKVVQPPKKEDNGGAFGG